MHILEKYIKSKFITYRRFSSLALISTATLYNMIRKGFIPNLETAIRIEQLTKGEVSVYGWIVKNKLKNKKKNTNQSKKTKEAKHSKDRFVSKS